LTAARVAVHLWQLWRDVMNFDMAAEMADVEDIRVEQVVQAKTLPLRQKSRIKRRAWPVIFMSIKTPAMRRRNGVAR
jgi:dihydroxyacetone kinase